MDAVPTPVLHGLAIGLFALGMALAMGTLAAQSSDEPRYYGMRGLRRRALVSAGGLFAMLDPTLRFCAPFARRLPLGNLRASIQIALYRAGDFMGLTADELIVCSLASALAVGVGFAQLVSFAGLPWVLAVFGAGLGVTIPYVVVTGRATARQARVERALPPAIDLMALCMSAGLGFTGAVKEVVSKGTHEEEPLREELSFLLHQIALGQTRDRALLTLADRVPSSAVRLFVSAVRQAEEKGTPLAEVLEIQAQSLRLRRSVAGEEAASKAAVRMLFPLLLVLVSILLVLMGPFVLRNSAAGFF